MRRRDRGLAEIAFAPGQFVLLSGLVMNYWWAGALWQHSALAAIGLVVLTFVVGIVAFAATVIGVDSPGTPVWTLFLGGGGTVWWHVHWLGWLDAPDYTATFGGAALAVLVPMGSYAALCIARKLVAGALGLDTTATDL